MTTYIYLDYLQIVAPSLIRQNINCEYCIFGSNRIITYFCKEKLYANNILTTGLYIQVLLK